jgi:hypothetical protein
MEHVSRRRRHTPPGTIADRTGDEPGVQAQFKPDVTCDGHFFEGVVLDVDILALVLGEAHFMTDQSTASSASHALFGTITPLVKTIALIVTIAGAIPTAITAYYAWDLKVPFTEVPHQLAQNKILMRNFDCVPKIKYNNLTTSGGTVVDAGACPKTSDILLRISAPGYNPTYEWIAFNQLTKPGDEPPSGLLDLLFGIAHAEDSAKSMRLAQGTFQVVCQTLVSKPSTSARRFPATPNARARVRPGAHPAWRLEAS